MVKKFMIEALDKLNPAAQAECKRLWEMRDTLTSLTEVTFPILCQYCGVWTKVQDLTNTLAQRRGQDLEDAIANLAKLQKIMFTYADVLGLNEKHAEKSNNKFFDLLTK